MYQRSHLASKKKGGIFAAFGGIILLIFRQKSDKNRLPYQ
jgi:hypothetical protein